MARITYSEKQYFRQWWIVFIMIPVPLIMLWAIFQQIVLDKPFGNHPAPDLALIIISIVVILPSVLFFLVRLETKIDDSGIFYRLIPFHIKLKKISWNDISEIYVRKYNPIGEYGGWGLKGSKKHGKAINVSGNMGLQIILKNGEKILVGTNKPDELNRILQTVKNKILNPTNNYS